MYGAAWERLSDQAKLLAVDWPQEYEPESLADLAAKVVAQIVAQWQDLRPTCIIGSSMGGMVALEMAIQSVCPRVVLIGSACQAS